MEHENGCEAEKNNQWREDMEAECSDHRPFHSPYSIDPHSQVLVLPWFVHCHLITFEWDEIGCGQKHGPLSQTPDLTDRGYIQVMPGELSDSRRHRSGNRCYHDTFLPVPVTYQRLV